MKQIAKVISKDGEYVNILAEKPSSCGESCGMCGMCDGRMKELKVLNTCNAEAGDKVYISLSSYKSLALCIITFFLPLVIFGAVYLASKSGFWAVLSLALSFLALGFFSNRLAKNKSFMSIITPADEDI